MKTKIFLTSVVIFLTCIACESFGPKPITITTGEYDWLTKEHVQLVGCINGDKDPYHSFVYGFLLSTNEEDVIAHEAEVFYTTNSDGDVDFYKSINNLTAGTTYYYCAWVMLNATEYVYGEVKSFTTPTQDYVEKPFSVSKTKKVYFSRANLQYHPQNNQWRFAEEQYDYIGDDNKYIATDYDGWIDLFGWGTGATPTLCTANTADYATFVDWGTNAIVGDPIGTWYTLTADEWEYLCRKRENAKGLCKFIYVEGVFGILLIPDGSDILSGAYGKMSRTYWHTLEQKGAVFLPAAGRRLGQLGIYAVQEYGCYWSSTKMNSSTAYGYFLQETGFSKKVQERHHGYSVRLVRDVD